MLRLASLLVFSNVAVASILIFGVSLSLKNSRDADIYEAQQAAANLANSLSIEIGAQMHLIENSLSTIALRVSDVHSEEERNRIVTKELAEQGMLLPQVSNLRFADASVTVGIEVNGKAVDVSKSSHFLSAAHVEKMVFSEPVLCDDSNEWCIVLARGLRTKNGNFYGIIYAEVRSDALMTRFSRLDMGDAGAIALRTNSLNLVARFSRSDPWSKKGVGEKIVSDELLDQLSKGDERGWYITPTPLDHIERITAYSRIEGYPLIALTGLATDEFLKNWRAEALRQALLVLMVLGITAAYSYYLFRTQRAERKARLEAIGVVQEQSLMLENNLVGMMRVRERKIVWANMATSRIFGYENGQLDGQPSRHLYLNDEDHQRIGIAGYTALRNDGRYSVQLQMQRQNGDAIWIDLSGAAVSEKESLWMMVDIDSIKRSEKNAQDLALSDALTGIANRRSFDLRLEGALSNARRNKKFIAVCYMDLDGFKKINDVYGHDAGDTVLCQTAKRLTEAIRGNDVVARLGGDEFAVLLNSVEGTAGATVVIQRCLEQIRESIEIAPGKYVQIDASIGIVVGSGDSAPQDLLRSADEMMYSVKKGGKGRIQAVAIKSVSKNTEEVK